MKPLRVIVFAFGEGEAITLAKIRERMEEKDYFIVEHPIVMRAEEPRKLLGIVRAP